MGRQRPILFTMIIFDLDHTVIDSSHRQLTLPCGKLDLAHWIENSTYDKVMADSLLPLAQTMQRATRNNHSMVCTARVLGAADFDFLIHHKLINAHTPILSRPEGVTLGDADLKEHLVNAWCNARGLVTETFARGAMFIDDNHAVLERVKGMGFNTHYAPAINKLLQGRTL